MSLVKLERCSRQRRQMLAEMRRPPPKIIEYGDLVLALKRRRLELGLTCLECDELAGHQAGYTAKLECWEDKSGRGLGKATLARHLKALRVWIAIEAVRRDEEHREKMRLFMQIKRREQSFRETEREKDRLRKQMLRTQQRKRAKKM